MPTLIPDLARTLTESTRRAALWADEERKRIEELYPRMENASQASVESESLRRRTAREARTATSRVSAEAHELATLWASAIRALRDGLSTQEQILVLQAYLDLTASLEAYRQSASRLWTLVEQMGGNPEESSELNEAAHTLERIRVEAERALQMRKTPWQPSDPARPGRSFGRSETGPWATTSRRLPQSWPTLRASRAFRTRLVPRSWMVTFKNSASMPKNPWL
jgi:hypothetical protein